MMSLPALAPTASWFMALPGSDAFGNVTAVVRDHASLSVPHGSGRPWLPGSWSMEEIRVAEAGRSRVAVIGRYPITATRLTRVTARAGQLERR
jgi:asparagine synthase (glutamine-hydrolysing)